VSPRVLLAVLVVSCLALTALDRTTSAFDSARTAVDAVLGPPQRAVSAVTTSAADTITAVVDRDVQEELKRLREENGRLRGELRRGDDAARRVAELDALLGAVDTSSAVPARVVSVGAAFGFRRAATIDAGARDGVRVDQTVRSGAGLVGRTVRVGPVTSTVLLLDDRGFGVGARLATEGTLGLVRGAGPGRVTYTHVEGGRVQVGDTVLSTGSDTFVADVPIGRVTALSTASGGLTTTADVEPFVDVATLDLVAVVVDDDRRPRDLLPAPTSP
jgi:rod shape-determining protein MreC